MTRSAATWALIPIKARGQGKTRLAPVLSPDEREHLVEVMLAHVVETLRTSVERTLLVGPERTTFHPDLHWIADPGGGLNAALNHALAAIVAMPNGPDRLIVLPADLPGLASAEIERLAHLPLGTLGLAADRHGCGTNGLSLPLPEAAGFRFCFGAGSAASHFKQARSLGLTVETIKEPGLEKDIDEPDDLADAGRLFSLAP